MKRSFEGHPRRMRALAAAVLCTSWLAIGLVSAAPASAESSSAWTPQYPWPHNGCTRVSDAPAGVSFTYACNHHDGCYAYHWADRGTCDAWFRNDMFGACYAAPWYLVYGCTAAANTYWAAVRVLGQPYYDSAGTISRISTPMTTG